MDIDRLKHSYSVALKMIAIGKERGLIDDELRDLFVLGLNHDIGYQFDKEGKNHNIIGGEILKNSGYKYWKEVYYHGMDQDEYNSLYLDILNEADMSIDKYGNDVGFESRLEDIGSRYGFDSKVYGRCVNIIKKLEMRK